MKRYFTLPLFVLIGSALLALTACSNLNPVMDNQLSDPASNIIFDSGLENDLIDDSAGPGENIVVFKIVPEEGWEVHPGEIILFQALLWDENKGVYQDVTNSHDCQFISAHFGKSVDGNDPSLTNGQEITIRAIYKQGWGAQTTGRFVNNQN